MLTEKDVEMIRQWRKEVVANRRKEVGLHIVSTTKDTLTGEEIESSFVETVLSVVTERSSRTASEIVRQDGAEVREGDIWFSVDIDELERINIRGTDGYDSVKYATNEGRRHRIVSWDRKGLGGTNRIEFLGKAVT